MKRFAATTLFAMSLAYMSNSVSQSDQPAAPGVGDGAAAMDANPAAKAAAERAREEAARQLKADAGEFNVVVIEPAQWTDSSLGCRRPGSKYSQVMTDGYSVVLERQGKQHQVNVAGARAVLCDPNLRTGGGAARQPMRARGLEQMTALARQDLANRLKLDVQHIRVVHMEPQQWTDGNMNCGSAGAAASAGPSEGATLGYRLALSASGRTYFYHTDLKSVRACPPIEAR